MLRGKSDKVIQAAHRVLLGEAPQCTALYPWGEALLSSLLTQHSSHHVLHLNITSSTFETAESGARPLAQSRTRAFTGSKRSLGALM